MSVSCPIFFNETYIFDVPKVGMDEKERIKVDKITKGNPKQRKIERNKKRKKMLKITKGK
jgi:hypothetical protein